MNSIIEGWRQIFFLPRPFQPAEREAEFLSHYCTRFASIRRGAGPLGTLVWLSYFFLDFLILNLEPAYRNAGTLILQLRIASCPIVFVLLALSLTRRYERDERFATTLIMAGTLTLALFLVMMQYIAPFPYDYVYYFQGLMLQLMFSLVMFRLRSKQVAFLLTGVAVLEICVLWLKAAPEPAQTLTQLSQVYPWMGTCLILTIAMIGFGVGVQLERAERASFEDNQKLAASHQALTESKAESEKHYDALVRTKEFMRADAEQRNKDKSRFLAHAVHDLKQPLQAISNVLHPALMASHKGEPERVTQLIELARTAAERMRHQLGAILDISRLESGHVQAEIADFEVGSLIFDVVEQQTRVAQVNQVRLEVLSSMDRRVYVLSDRAFLERILLNLIGNGIKYREPKRQGGSFVQLRIVPQEEHLRIDVIDNGIGIPDHDLDSGAIFEPFFQINNRHQESEKGVGLGLSIIRAMLVMLKSHRLEVQSTFGQGSVFSLTLPLSDDQSPPAIPIPSGSDGTFPILNGIYVLLIEDDDLVRRSTEAMFDAHGVLYESYSDHESYLLGAEDLERIPDVLLSDFRLPNGKTAIDVIAHARHAFPDTQIVVFSGEIGDFSEVEKMKGVVFLRKPLAPFELLNVLTHASA